MKLENIQSKSAEDHIRRLLGAKQVVVREYDREQIKGVTITTESGTIDFSVGPYGNGIFMSCTVPSKVYMASFTAFDTNLEKRFETEEQRKDFVATLPEETQSTVKLSEITEG